MFFSCLDRWSGLDSSNGFDSYKSTKNLRLFYVFCCLYRWSGLDSNIGLDGLDRNSGLVS